MSGAKGKRGEKIGKAVRFEWGRILGQQGKEGKEIGEQRDSSGVKG